MNVAGPGSPRSTAGEDTRYSRLPSMLRQAVTAHEDGRLDVAEPLYRRFLEESPRQATALQLLGLLHSQRREYDAAIALMRQSLEVFPDQAEVANNLGNALSRSGRLDEAIESYSRAVQIQPRYTDAWRNLGLCQLEKNQPRAAAECFQHCLALRANDPVSWLCLGNAQKRRDQVDEAIICYEKAIALQPDYADAHHNLGLCLRIRQQPRKAIGHYRKALDLGLNRREVYHNLGNVLVDVGEVGGAIDAYQAAVKRNPRDLESHRNLNSLLWQQELLDDYLVSYGEALELDPAAVELRLAYAMALNQQEAFADAERVILQGLRHSPDSSELKSLLGFTLEGQGRWSEALEMHAAAVKMPEAVPNHRISYARALLARGRPEEALLQAKAGASRMPFNQRALAYLGLCWRLLGDERDRLLNDYERMIRIYDVPVPAGFAGAREYNERLNEVLDALHVGKRHPPEQTLRGGTQTSGDLFVRSEPEIADLVTGLKQCIESYIEEMPCNPEHPLFSRRGKSFRFSASWSVRLARCGYHTMHVHPLGWISSAYYVQVPAGVAGSGSGSGALKFGEPDIDLGAEGAARRRIVPAVGRLVLFPSYMWHGTVPFDDDAARTTVAFDVIPDAR